MLNFILVMSQPTEGGEGSGFLGLLPFLLIFLIFYMLLIRPQIKQQKKKQSMIKALKKGDSVITVGGLHGTIEGVKESEDIIILKIADNTKVKVSRSSVAIAKESKS